MINSRTVASGLGSKEVRAKIDAAETVILEGKGTMHQKLEQCLGSINYLGLNPRECAQLAAEGLVYDQKTVQELLRAEQLNRERRRSPGMVEDILKRSDSDELVPVPKPEPGTITLWCDQPLSSLPIDNLDDFADLQNPEFLEKTAKAFNPMRHEDRESFNRRFWEGMPLDERPYTEEWITAAPVPGYYRLRLPIPHSNKKSEPEQAALFLQDEESAPASIVATTVILRKLTRTQGDLAFAEDGTLDHNIFCRETKGDRAIAVKAGIGLLSINSMRRKERPEESYYDWIAGVRRVKNDVE